MLASLLFFRFQTTLTTYVQAVKMNTGSEQRGCFISVFCFVSTDLIDKPF